MNKQILHVFCTIMCSVDVNFIEVHWEQSRNRMTAFNAGNAALVQWKAFANSKVEMMAGTGSRAETSFLTCWAMAPPVSECA